MRYRLYTFISFIFILVSLDVNAQCVTDGHSNVWADNWISCSTSPNPNSVRGNTHWIQYDLGAPYFLGTSQIWNANLAGATNRGVQQMVIDYSMDGINWVEWGTFNLSQAPGTNGYLGENGPNFQGLKAQYVLLTVTNTYGDPTCASLAEVRFDVEPQINSQIDLTVLLEGPYRASTQMMEANLTAFAPLNHPYGVAPYYHLGTETLSSFPTNAIDWLLLEVRQGTPSIAGQRTTQTIDQQAVILLEDGSVVDVDGNLPTFELAQGRDYYFCIRHRNHLDVLTANAITAASTMSYDLTSGQTQALGTQQLTILSNGATALFGGDYTQDGVIQTTDYDVWQMNPAILNVYSLTDGNLDATVQTTDYDLWFPNRAKLGSVEIAF